MSEDFNLDPSRAVFSRTQKSMVAPSISSCNLSMKSTPNTVKFLCSYGGKILPRYPDGKLRYHSGETRVLAVDRSISFAELLVKLGEMCGASVSLRCQLPTEDLDALISITSDEDLANLFEEYDRAGAASPTSALKIRAFLFLRKSTKKVSPTSSIAFPTSNDIATSPKSPYPAAASLSTRRPTPPTTDRFIHHISRPAVKYPHPLCYETAAEKLPQFIKILPLDIQMRNPIPGDANNSLWELSPSGGSGAEIRPVGIIGSGCYRKSVNSFCNTHLFNLLIQERLGVLWAKASWCMKLTNY